MQAMADVYWDACVMAQCTRARLNLHPVNLTVIQGPTSDTSGERFDADELRSSASLISAVTFIIQLIWALLKQLQARWKSGAPLELYILQPANDAGADDQIADLSTHLRSFKERSHYAEFLSKHFVLLQYNVPVSSLFFHPFSPYFVAVC